MKERTGRLVKNENISGESLSARAVVLLLLSAGFLVLSGCGKKEAQQRGLSSLGEKDSEAVSLEGKAIVGTLDWIAATAINPKHPASKLAQAVGLITIPQKESRCTAFLVDTNVVMTNWHCFPTAEDATGARVYLDYLTGTSAESYLGTASFACDQWIMSNEELDVALLRCTGNPGATHGVVTLEEGGKGHSIGEKIYVIQQNCDYYSSSDCPPTKKAAVGALVDKGDAPEPARSHDLFYSADTLGGSSGSPVFSLDTNRVIALHHNGHGQSPWSGGRGTMNSGMPMPAIVKYLKAQFPNIHLTTNIP